MKRKRKCAVTGGKTKKRKVYSSAIDHEEARKEVDSEKEIKMELEKRQDGDQTKCGTVSGGGEVC